MNFPSIMEIQKNPHDWLRNIQNTDLENLYSSTLELQVEITKNEVLKTLVQDWSWNQANSVLDLGCGPGYLTHLLFNYYPKKSYSGVDLNPKFIDMANQLNPTINFIQSDIYDFSPNETFDYIHVRAVLQHLPDLNRFIEKLTETTHKGSSILFLDSAGSEVVNSHFIPDIPSYNRFFKELSEKQKAKGGDRDCLTELEKQISNHPYDIDMSEDFYASNTSSESKEEYFYYIFFVCELLDRMYEVKSDKEQLINELFNWHRAKHSYSQFHGKWVRLKRK